MAQNTSTRPRLTIDISLALRRRIRLAAAADDLSVSEYVAGILDRTVPAEVERTDAPRGWTVVKSDIERFEMIRETVMKGRCFTVDSVDLIAEARAERMDQL